MTDEGGDAACWAERVCDGCGAVVEPGTDHRCVRTVRLDRLQLSHGAYGVVWSLGGPRQVEANLVYLGPGRSMAAHVNQDMDVLIVVIGGSASVFADGHARALAVHDLALVPRGARRAVIAGSDGCRYLSVHIAKPGPTIRTR